MVSRFTEKPTVEKAKELLAQNAFWNGGVFAFRLGYMMNIVRKYMPIGNDNDDDNQICDFESVRNRYSEFPKISFDYEVAEKAQSVAVVLFNGEWKDLGTWNTLTDELQNPIFVDGLKDVVVAACPDGILVCSKEHSEEIKKSVENLTPRPMYEERRWGSYRVLDDSYYADGRHSLTKSITLKGGKNIIYQIHHHRSETWTLVQGDGIFVLDGKEQKVKAGDTVVIPVEHWHAMKALTELTFIEVQSGTPLIEEDIERTEWKWSEQNKWSGTKDFVLAFGGLRCLRSFVQNPAFF